MINSRNKGNSYERKIRRRLLKLYPDCQTSRFASKYVDDIEKRDLCNTGLCGIQIKATHNQPNFHKLLKEMPEDDKCNMVIHKQDGGSEIVVMSFEDFYEILEIMKYNGIKI